jgi:hypothetical protein
MILTGPLPRNAEGRLLSRAEYDSHPILYVTRQGLPPPSRWRRLIDYAPTDK